MGFYELGNGCDSCDTISPIIPNNINMQMDTNSAYLANMAMPYGAQANTVQQYNNSVTNSGYPQQGTNFGSMGTGSNGSTMGGQAKPTQQVMMQTMPSSTQPSQVVKQVVTTTTTTPNVPGTKKVPLVTNTVNSYEGFSNGSSDGSSNMLNNEKKWIVLGLVIFSALSLNECCKYFLNKSLQLNDGSPMYYVAYAGVAILLTMAANKYSSS
jgi:hypothetical protein